MNEKKYWYDKLKQKLDQTYGYQPNFSGLGATEEEGFRFDRYGDPFLVLLSPYFSDAQRLYMTEEVEKEFLEVYQFVTQRADQGDQGYAGFVYNPVDGTLYQVQYLGQGFEKLVFKDADGDIIVLTPDPPDYTLDIFNNIRMDSEINEIDYPLNLGTIHLPTTERLGTATPADYAEPIAEPDGEVDLVFKKNPFGLDLNIYRMPEYLVGSRLFLDTYSSSYDPAGYLDRLLVDFGSLYGWQGQPDEKDFSISTLQYYLLYWVNHSYENFRYLQQRQGTEAFFYVEAVVSILEAIRNSIEGINNLDSFGSRWSQPQYGSLRPDLNYSLIDLPLAFGFDSSLAEEVRNDWGPELTRPMQTAKEKREKVLLRMFSANSPLDKNQIKDLIANTIDHPEEPDYNLYDVCAMMARTAELRGFSFEDVISDSLVQSFRLMVSEAPEYGTLKLDIADRNVGFTQDEYFTLILFDIFIFTDMTSPYRPNEFATGYRHLPQGFKWDSRRKKFRRESSS